MKYGLIGASGKLGKEIISVFTEHNSELVFSLDIQGEWKQSDPEILIDCSLPEAFEKVITLANNFNVPLIVATTGLSDQNINQLQKFAEKKPVVQSYNFSIGIQLLLELTKKAYEKVPDWDIEISETHHRFKKINHPGLPK